MGSDGSQQPLQYRYNVSPASTVNFYQPKKLADDADWQNLKSAHLGAAFHDNYDKVLRSSTCSVVFEAR